MREDWTECLLGEISSKITKGSTPTTYGYKYQKEGINFIKIENVVKGRIDLKSIYQFISEEAHNSQKRSQLEEGDVLFSIAGTIGETCLITKEVLPANTNQAFAIISGFNKVLDANFLRKQLDSFVSRKLIDKARGGAMNNVSLTDLKKLNLVIPPLVEQRAIVKKIEGFFSNLDQGIIELKKAQGQLKIYRQAVLKKAFEGGINKGWKECLLGEISSKITKGSTPTTYGYKYQKEGINFIKIENVVKGRIDLKSIYQFISEEAHNSQKRSQLEEGDVLFSIAGTIGETCLITKEVLPANTNQAFAIISGFNKVLDANFLRKQLDSFVSRKLKDKARGGAMNNVSLTDLKNLNVVIPPFEKQTQILQEIELRLTICDKLEESIKDSLEKAKALRQSILKKAFEGTLLSEEELAHCNAAPSYESASILLDKFKAQKN